MIPAGLARVLQESSGLLQDCKPKTGTELSRTGTELSRTGTELSRTGTELSRNGTELGRILLN
ncbi:hypothetical protein K443DRAFT_14658 [Laccaria amethystina LaAM-08-1]|uniref:Unplaced genomic scaffold K443scaffold_515, whole genome shotgun sequence n=1 Tax=Laccaria amethystina LaAM-08-1 TaxID=1095629 RepID=A0A0C9WSR2_9AGAR|nr:hypothetical protein K443DRAFT_14658 [Laccaria amethystina LaAM-08-1]